MKIICIGRNYPLHIEELENERPENPVVFLKPDTAILNKEQPFVLPEFSNQIEHEVEILVKISKVGKYISPKFAHKYYEQIGLGIDFTARDLQNKLKTKGLPWEISKGFDGSAVVGAFFLKSEFQSLENLEFRLEKNNQIVQKGNTQNMLFGIDEIISYISQFYTLKVGDIIYTGTPSGVGTVSANDVLIGYIEDKKAFEVKVM